MNCHVLTMRSAQMLLVKVHFIAVIMTGLVRTCPLDTESFELTVRELAYVKQYDNVSESCK